MPRFNPDKLAILLLAWIALTGGVASAVNTAFDYSGTLQEPAGQSAAAYDFIFSICTPSASEPLWQSAVYEDVSCVNGNFTVTIDPGDLAVFEHTPITLRIATRPAGSTGTFTPVTDQPEIDWRPLGIKASKFKTHSTTEKIWIAIGLFGQIFFTARFLVQWIASERAQKSVVPESFWIFSVLGCTIVLMYAFYRQDPVFILAYLFNNLIYFRNLVFIHRAKKKDAGASPADIP